MPPPDLSRYLERRWPSNAGAGRPVSAVTPSAIRESVPLLRAGRSGLLTLEQAPELRRPCQRGGAAGASVTAWMHVSARASWQHRQWRLHSPVTVTPPNAPHPARASRQRLERKGDRIWRPHTPALADRLAPAWTDRSVPAAPQGRNARNGGRRRCGVERQRGQESRLRGAAWAGSGRVQPSARRTTRPRCSSAPRASPRRALLTRSCWRRAAREQGWPA